MKVILRKKKEAAGFFMMILIVLMASACTGAAGGNAANGGREADASKEQSSPAGEQAITDQAEQREHANTDDEENDMIYVNIRIDSQVFEAEFYDNDSARAIVSGMPFSLEMNDYASQEKVAALTFALPSAETETPAAIKAGEIYLWSGSSLVLFYTTFANVYSYVPVGYIIDTNGLTDALGTGSVTVVFEEAE